MRLPRDLSGIELSKRLAKYGYSIIRQTGSHMRLRTESNGEHCITIPKHNPMRIGTIAGILLEVSRHFDMSKDELIVKLFCE